MAKRNCIVTLSTGQKLKLRPISPLLTQRIEQAVRKEMEAEGRWRMSPPTYVVETVAGVVEEHAHDETTVNTDEERAALAEYQAAQEELQMRCNERIVRACLVFGVEDVKIPESWLDDQRWIGASIPEDPRELKYTYLLDNVLARHEDRILVMTQVLKITLSSILPDDVAAAEELFRDSVEGQAVGEPAT